MLISWRSLSVISVFLGFSSCSRGVLQTNTTQNLVRNPAAQRSNTNYISSGTPQQGVVCQPDSLLGLSRGGGITQGAGAAKLGGDPAHQPQPGSCQFGPASPTSCNRPKLNTSQPPLALPHLAHHGQNVLPALRPSVGGVQVVQRDVLRSWGSSSWGSGSWAGLKREFEKAMAVTVGLRRQRESGW